MKAGPSEQLVGVESPSSVRRPPSARAPRPTGSPGGAALPGRQRATKLQSEAVAGWRLLDWINLFDPGGMTDSRSWRWWNGGAGGAPPVGSDSAPTATPTAAAARCTG